MNYVKFQPVIHGEYGITEYPTVPNKVSFLSGQFINQSLPNPLIFEVTVPPNASPGHLLGSMIPVASKAFINALHSAGVDNIQALPAILRNKAAKFEWTDYYALNIIGLIDCADMSASNFDPIIGTGALPPLVAFDEIVLIGSKIGQYKMFRVSQSPIDMFMATTVLDSLISHKPPGGWGITTSPVVVR